MLNLYAAIAKIDREKRLVFGYASTEALDQQGEIVRREAIEAALPEYMRFANIREMHQPSAVGVAEEAQVDGRGLWLGARVVDERAWEKVKEGVYKGFSIGGKVTARDPQNRKIITGVDLTEISLVDRPANPEATFEMVKRADGVLGPQPFSKWDCGVAAHRHGEAGEAARCMERQMSVDRAGEIMQSVNDTLAKLEGAFAKRAYTAAERQTLALRGEALPDGSFPIKDRDDLANALHDYGRAKDQARARAHIITCAEALGATDLLPPEWRAGAAPRRAAVVKGMQVVACLARLLDEIRWLQQTAAVEQVAAGNADGEVAAKLGAWLASGVSLLGEVVAAASEALIDGEDVGSMDNEIGAFLAERSADADRSWPLTLAGALRRPALGKPAAAAAGERRRRVAAALEKIGARNSKADLERIQRIHDHAVELGASCLSGGKAARGEDLRKALGARDAAVDALEKFAARVTPLIGEVSDLKARLAVVEATPLPPRAVLRAIAISKEDDRGGIGGAHLEARLAAAPIGSERANEILRQAYFRPSAGSR